jgi:hypothetical protein
MVKNVDQDGGKKRSVLDTVLENVLKQCRSHVFRETFASEVLQPLAESAFGTCIRNALYALMTVLVLVLLMMFVMCIFLVKLHFSIINIRHG